MGATQQFEAVDRPAREPRAAQLLAQPALRVGQPARFADAGAQAATP